MLRSIDDIVFSLLILGGLTDSRGNVWRRHPSQLYAIELTLPSNKVNFKIMNHYFSCLVIHFGVCSNKKSH